MYLFMAVLGLCGCVGVSHCSEWGLLSSCSTGLLTAVASLSGTCRFPYLQHAGSMVCMPSSCGHRLSCPTECRIFLDQGWNPCLLPWQVDSLIPEPPEKPWSYSFKKLVSKRDNWASQMTMVILLAFIPLIIITGIYWVLAVYHTIICILNSLFNLLCNCTKDMLNIDV